MTIRPVTTVHARLLAVVAVVAVATVVGLVALWPPPAAPAPDTGAVEDTVAGTVRSVTADPHGDALTSLAGALLEVSVQIDEGPQAGQTTTVTATDGVHGRFTPGDRVLLARSEQADGTVTHVLAEVVRSPALWWLAALFVVATVAVGRWYGVRSLVGLALSLTVVIGFIVPAIVAGTSPPVAALVGAAAVMLVTLYLSHGVNEKTTAAVIGTTAALVATVALGQLFIAGAKITGFTLEDVSLVAFTLDGVDTSGLVLAGLIIAALGVLDDVTVSQSSTVFTLHTTDPSLGFGELFRRAMHVGRDHISAVVNTLFLAYAGGSLGLLVLLSTAPVSWRQLLNSELLAREVVMAGVGSVGLIAAVPLTTAVAAAVVTRQPAPVTSRRGRTMRGRAGR